MRPLVQRFASGLLLSASLMLAACGGGDSQPVAYDIGMLVSGQPVAGVHLQPGLQQSIQVRVGQSFEFDSSAPVTWSATFSGKVLEPVLDSYFVDGLILTLTTVTTDRFSAYTSGMIASGTPVPLKLVVTSLQDPTQKSYIDVTFIN